MKKLDKALFLSFALMACVNAQAQVVKFPMEMSADATTIESVSNQKFQAQGALAPGFCGWCPGKCVATGWLFFPVFQAKIDPTLVDGQSQMTFSLWVAPESYPVMRLDEDGECFTTMAGNLKASDLNVVESGDKGFAFRLGSRGTYMFICHVKGWKVMLKAMTNWRVTSGIIWW